MWKTVQKGRLIIASDDERTSACSSKYRDSFVLESQLIYLKPEQERTR